MRRSAGANRPRARRCNPWRASTRPSRPAAPAELVVPGRDGIRHASALAAPTAPGVRALLRPCCAGHFLSLWPWGPGKPVGREAGLKRRRAPSGAHLPPSLLRARLEPVRRLSLLPACAHVCASARGHVPPVTLCCGPRRLSGGERREASGGRRDAGGEARDALRPPPWEGHRRALYAGPWSDCDGAGAASQPAISPAMGVCSRWQVVGKSLAKVQRHVIPQPIPERPRLPF